MVLVIEVKLTPLMMAPVNVEVVMEFLVKSAPVKLAPVKFVKLMVLSRLAPVRSAPVKSAPLMDPNVKLAFCSTAPVNVANVRRVELNFAEFMLENTEIPQAHIDG